MLVGRQRLSLFATIITVLCLLLIAAVKWEQLYLSLCYYRTYYVASGTAGWFYVSRLTGEQSERMKAWHVESGFLALDQGSGARTDFDTDGSVSIQFSGSHEPEFRTEPPWLFGVQDQLVPSAPWLAEGSSFRDWWAAIPDEVKE